jgi:hypothetical protein
MKYLFPVLVLVIVLLIGPQIYNTWRTDQEIRQKINTSVDRLNQTGYAGKNRSGYMVVDGDVRKFTEKWLHRMLKHEPRQDGGTYLWNWGNVSRAAASAMGIDKRHHFTNSYLVGYQPFVAKRVWVPLYTLALRKRYEYDHLQYGGLKEVWQTSRQAYYYTRGDCEDHAMVLADWLIEMGIDARVVLGNHKEEGHAWVVFLLNSKTYLLEATSKRKKRSMGAIPAAAVMVNYHPQYQFNRDNFWVNTGSQFTTKYTGAHWKLKSKFFATN